MTEMSTQHGTFSRQDIAVSQEESPGFSRGEDVKKIESERSFFTSEDAKKSKCVKCANNQGARFGIIGDCALTKKQLTKYSIKFSDL